MHVLGPVVLFLVVLEFTFLCVSVYLHRAMTHRSIEINSAVGNIIRFWLWISTGQPVRSWVAVHLKHHSKSDQEGDPHSPYLVGLWHIVFANEFYYGKVAQDPAVLERYAKHITPTRMDFLWERSWLGWVLGVMIAMLCFGWVVGPILYGLHLLLYLRGGGIINGVCHMIGYRNFDDNKATNVWWAGWLLAGEGWHNNHHHDPNSPKFSCTKREFDPGWLFFKVLELFGLAKQVKETIPSQ